MKYLPTLFCVVLTSSRLFAAQTPDIPEVLLVDAAQQQPTLTYLDRQYLVDRLNQLDLQACQSRILREQPRVDYRQLSLPFAGSTLHINVAADVMRTRNLVIYTASGDEWREYYNCAEDTLLPVLAIIATAKVEGAEIGSNAIRQEVLTRHTQLSSYEPSHLLVRSDSDDINAGYLDFTLSSKHPVFANASLLETAQADLADLMENFIPGDSEYLMQLYLAFSGRFSQYIGTRDSSPVVARRFNPALFYRLWSTNENWIDLGFAHESNGQRINSQASFLREQQDYIARGETPEFARDALSRGWDYSFMEWRQQWNSKISTQLQLSHYLRSGPLQGNSEEYNLWEDGGTQVRPRRQYDGVSMSVQYQFNRSRCFLGSTAICMSDLELTQTTGYSAMFENNTTTLELTTDVLGLPIQLWGRAGYNSDLVDYYNYSTSWGLGIQLKTP